MADELNKKNPNFDSGSSSESAPKPKTIGTPAPNVPKPKQTPTTKPQLAPKSSMPKKMTVKPGNPNLGESAPVGIQRKRFESDKHANKRLNKMFNETKAATLGVWNHDNTHPMAKPNSVKFNPNLEYKPSQEQIKQARQKIMAQGFRPKSDQEANKLVDEVKPEQPKQLSPKAQSLQEIDRLGGTNVGVGNGNAIDAFKYNGKYYARSYPDSFDGPGDDDMTDIYFQDENGNDIDGFDSFEELMSALHKDGYPVYDSLLEKESDEADEREKASELFGTDLNKADNNENIGFESDNEQDMNLYHFARGLGHDDATARVLVAHYKEGGDFAGIPRWKLEEIANGTADKNRWPFK